MIAVVFCHSFNKVKAGKLFACIRAIPFLRKPEKLFGTVNPSRKAVPEGVLLYGEGEDCLYPGNFNAFALFLVAVRIILLPSPRVAAHIYDSLFCTPAELARCLGGIGVAYGYIAGATRCNFIVNL